MPAVADGHYFIGTYEPDIPLYPSPVFDPL